MTLRDYLRVFGHRWLLIAVTTLLAGGVTWFLTPEDAGQETAMSYTSKATLVVGFAPTETSQPNPMANGGLARIALYVTSGEVPAEVAKKIDYKGDPALLAQEVEVTPDFKSQSLTIASNNASAQRSEMVANAFADEAVRFFQGNNPATVGTTLTILQRATALPDKGKGSLVPPGRIPRTALAAGLGLLLGLILALLVERVDSRLRSREDIQRALGLPIIAEVPKLARKLRERAGTVVASQPLSVFADGYRAARTAISHTLTRAMSNPGPDSRPRDPNLAPWVLVTSAGPGEGKTTSVGNLAASFAEAGNRVLVIDADLRKPDTHRVFDVPQGAGISDFLVNPELTALAALVRPTNVPNVSIITAGTQLDYPAALASRMGVVREESGWLADIILIDSAPLLAASDVFDILPLADTVMIVARSGRLTEDAGRRVAELLGRFRIPVAGVLLIGSRSGGRRGLVPGYGAGYGEDARRAPSHGSRRDKGRAGSRRAADAPPDEVASTERLRSSDHRSTHPSS